jgi:methylthioribulose-1-phosphate dehydratase
MNRYQAETGIVAAGAYFHSRGWVPATAGNFSARLTNNFLITRSGVHKGTITVNDLLLVNEKGDIFHEDSDHPANTEVRTSAETLLHLDLYRIFPEAKAVFHVHSPHGTVLSRYIINQGRDSLILRNYELLKALGDNQTHENEEMIPVFPNSQNITKLSETISHRIQDIILKGDFLPHAYLLEGHGLYTWGRSLEEALRHIEALEFMFECEVLEAGLK